ncbi:MAG: tRNA (guanosine(37)-N1)-methyltransferase TrmD [Acidobacteria bacterium]|nr:tRNA (guanosine(37)-N1)-methyltransferase TrmD [Acidobacteriota bacterium]
MRIDVITIFPELFGPFLDTSLIGRARSKGLLEINVHDLRDHTEDRHRSVDDEPYGGGGGMVMTAPPWIAAVQRISAGRNPRRIYLSPQGQPLTDGKVRELTASGDDLLLLCGRYEGVDERVLETVVDEEISIGDYVLSGGELPAMVLIEALSRQVPGVVGQPLSVENDSFRGGLLDHPQYTRPPVVEGLEVPAVLLSGDHAAIEAWRRQQRFEATGRKRPDLLARREGTTCRSKRSNGRRAEELKVDEGAAGGPAVASQTTDTE